MSWNPYSRVNAEINLDAVTHNLDVMRKNLAPDTPICAVIKADGYGHGAVPIAHHIEKRTDIWGFAVATAEEGVTLRKAGIQKPILLLGYVFPESYEALLEFDLTGCIFEEESARLLSDAAAKCGKTAHVHIAVDTGMSRIGFQVCQQDADIVKTIAGLPNLSVDGLFSHFARCDETDLTPASVQFRRFCKFEKMLDESGVSIPIHHICNSAGIMRFREGNRDLVRAGITLYGLTPSTEIIDEVKGIKSVMRITSHLSYVKTLPAGREISYGGTYRTTKETRVATIPVGYADGYPRLLSGKGEVLIGGKRAPILGRVCMDQFMADVTEIPSCRAGDEVVLLGEMGDERITAEELGHLSGRFNYELVCNVTKRVPRTYLSGGRIVEQVDYFS